uniref:WAT1-related protein n=1 Tax=Ananas comosus var. bracteatus TaxID=296719 RepID=A0A6V7PKC3_ANACO|nr:unnamed protein product [Ananas comosus var. bracteatus]
MMMMGWWREWGPVAVMVAADVGFAVMNVMIKKVIDEGMDRLVIVTLRQLVATFFMAPIAKTRPKLTGEIFVYLFFSALFGASLPQYLFFVGLQYTSATFSCAFLNMAPIFTFLIALPLRLETLDLKSKAGMTKLLGTITCLSGAILLTLYQGPVLPHKHSTQTLIKPYHMGYSSNTKQWMVGSIALLAGCLCWASWFLLQSKLCKKYPAIYSATALIFSLSFVQAAALSLATQKSISVWVLKKKLEIVTVVFSGVVGSGLGFLAMSWCVGKRGPVFTAAFTPLIQIMVAAFDFSILHEQLHLGSILGSALVIMGLYFLLWGKSKEAQLSNGVKPNEEHVELPPVQVQTV